MDRRGTPGQGERTGGDGGFGQCRVRTIQQVGPNRSLPDAGDLSGRAELALRQFEQDHPPVGAHGRRQRRDPVLATGITAEEEVKGHYRSAATRQFLDQAGWDATRQPVEPRGLGEVGHGTVARETTSQRLRPRDRIGRQGPQPRQGIAIETDDDRLWRRRARSAHLKQPCETDVLLEAKPNLWQRQGNAEYGDQPRDGIDPQASTKQHAPT